MIMDYERIIIYKDSILLNLLQRILCLNQKNYEFLILKTHVINSTKKPF